MIKNIIIFFTILFLTSCSNGGFSNLFKSKPTNNNQITMQQKQQMQQMQQMHNNIDDNIYNNKNNSQELIKLMKDTLIGPKLALNVGPLFSKVDLEYYHQTSQYSLENSKNGTTSSWVNSLSGNSGAITPTKTFQLANGKYCREYTQTINIGTKSSQDYNVACRNNGGLWQINDKL